MSYDDSEGQSMAHWWERPRVMAGALIIAVVVALAAVVGVLFLVLGGDDDGGREQAAAPTATSSAAPDGTPPAEATPESGDNPPPTATVAGAQDPDQGLEAFVRDNLGSQHIGDCPQTLAPDEEPPDGICSAELYRSAELVTFMLGVPFSEGIGELVFSLNEDGSWSAQFINAPLLGEMLEVGKEAVVFGAGDCLNFRTAAGLSADIQWCQMDGTRGTVAEGPVEADGHTWWRLEGLGWGSGEFLGPVAD